MALADKPYICLTIMKNMKKLLLAFSLLTFILSGCGGVQAPEESEVLAKIRGEYCSEDGYKLLLKDDNTYYNQRIQKSVYTGAPLLERCEGKYSLSLDSETNTWKLVFEKSTENSNPIVTCSGEVLVWEAEKGYLLGGDSAFVLTEMFDNKQVTKNSCE